MEKSFLQFLPDLLSSYERVGGLDHRDSHNLPSKRAVGMICEDLLQLLFPGFNDVDAIHSGSIEEVTLERLARVVARLTDQVRRSVRIGNPKTPTGRTPPIIAQFCKSLAGVREILRTDIEEAFNGDPATVHREEIILSYPFVGDNSTIGGNVFLMHSVPPNSLVHFRGNDLVVQEKPFRRDAAEFDCAI